MGSLKLTVAQESWPLTIPFRITGHTFTTLDVLCVTLEQDGRRGCGEAVGIYYRNDTAALLAKQVEEQRAAIERGITRETLQRILPAGGARNAVDCAMWDLEAKLAGSPVWKLANLSKPRPLITTFACGADTPERMAAAATDYTEARAIKLKLTGEPVDRDRVRAVREARPEVWLGVDANQGFTRPFLERLMPDLVHTGVSLIEQPFAVGQEALLQDFRSPIPIAADETVQTIDDIPDLVGRFNVVNLKLDKSGGLTEALRMAHAAHECGLETMIGNMIGTSLAMAPSFLVGQLCKVVDLDGPVFLKEDRTIKVKYQDGFISAEEAVWGGAE